MRRRSRRREWTRTTSKMVRQTHRECVRAEQEQQHELTSFACCVLALTSVRPRLHVQLCGWHHGGAGGEWSRQGCHVRGNTHKPAASQPPDDVCSHLCFVMCPLSQLEPPRRVRVSGAGVPS